MELRAGLIGNEYSDSDDPRWAAAQLQVEELHGGFCCARSIQQRIFGFVDPTNGLLQQRVANGMVNPVLFDRFSIFTLA